MHYFDILIFALIAVFLALRLRSVLGSRTGEEKPPPADAYSPRGTGRDDDKVVRFPGAGRQDEARDADFETAPPGAEMSDPKPVIDFASFGNAGLGLEAIHKADPNFDPAGFLSGARTAFEMIVTAFAQGDKQTLKGLLTPQVYKDFLGVIEERERLGQTAICQLVGISDVRFDAARLDASQAYVTLRFTSEQVNAVKDSKGEVVDGDAAKIEKAIDVWTFLRDVRSKDPNWFLFETLIPE